MRFGANRGQLYDAQKSARGRWDDTRDVWDDVARREFDEVTWQPLDQLVGDVLRAIDQLTVACAQVRHDCEFHP